MQANQFFSIPKMAGPRRGRLPIRTRLEDQMMPIPESGCWVWVGGVNPQGYGGIKWKQKTYRVHRLSWEIFRGSIPKNLHVLHRCDITACFNPDHLFLGTDLDNSQDMIRKGRNKQQKGLRNGAYTKPESRRRGEMNGSAKLTATEVLAIRSSKKRPADLVREFKVSFPTIVRILTRKNWKHI